MYIESNKLDNVLERLYKYLVDTSEYNIEVTSSVVVFK